MSATRIALVDDSLGDRTIFEAVGRERWAHVDIFASFGQFQRARKSGVDWDVVFIDFNLGLDEPSGFSTLLELHLSGSAARGVVYTQFVENGRFPFALAAKHWYASAASVDKGEFKKPADVKPFVEALLSGFDPTARNRKVQLGHAAVIDDILRDPIDLIIWRAILKHQRSSAILSALGPHGVKKTRFYAWVAEKEVGVLRMLNLKGNREIDDEVGPITGRGNVAVLLDFLGRNDQFFDAVDLSTVFNARPLQA